MRDELFHRDFDEGRDALNDGIDSLIAGIGAVFVAIRRINFAAPWRGGRVSSH